MTRADVMLSAKRDAIARLYLQLLAELGHRPSQAEYCARWSVSERTAQRDWIELRRAGALPSDHALSLPGVAPRPLNAERPELAPRSAPATRRDAARFDGCGRG